MVSGLSPVSLSRAYLEHRSLYSNSVAFLISDFVKFVSEVDDPNYFRKHFPSRNKEDTWHFFFLFILFFFIIITLFSFMFYGASGLFHSYLEPS